MIQTIAISSIALYGLIISFVIAIKLDVAKRLGLDDARVGTLFSTLMISGAVSIFFISPAIDVLGHKFIVVAGFLILFVSVALFGFVKSYRSMLLIHVTISLGAMAIISVGNTLLPVVLFGGKNPPAALNLGNVFYGVGAFFASFTLGYFLSKTGFKKTAILYSLLFFVVLILSFFARYPSVNTDFNLSKAFGLFSNKYFLLAVAANFFASGSENGVGAWINTYLSRAGYREQIANTFLSLFFVSIMLSRIICTFYVTPTNTPIAILIYALVSSVLIVILIVNRSKIVAAITFMLLGVTLGANVPNIFGYMFSNLDASLHGSAFGICFSLGLTGASILPAIVGIISKKSTIQIAFTINLIGAVLLSLVAYFMT